MESFDGSIQLGINSALDPDKDYSNIVGISNASIVVNGTDVRMTITLEVMYGEWINANFDEIVNPLVSEVTSFDANAPNAGDIPQTDPPRGLWRIQFGWFDHETGQEVVSVPIIMASVECAVTSDSAAFGTVVINKTLAFLPAMYLYDTFMADMPKTLSVLREEQVSDENTAQSNLVPQRLIEAVVDDLARKYPGAPAVPTLDSFLYLGTNIFNIGAETVFRTWIKTPMANTTAALAALDPARAPELSVFMWLKTWMDDNYMSLLPIPCRPLSRGGNLGFIVRYAPNSVDDMTDTYNQALATNAVNEDTGLTEYAVQWEPELSILDRASIVESAGFQVQTGQHSMASIKYYRDVFIPGLIGEPAPDPRDETASSTTDDTEQRKGNQNRSAFLEMLKGAMKTVTVNLMGQPELAVFDVLRIDAANPLFDGIYAVQSLSHSISRGSFSTEFEAYRLSANPESQIANVSKEVNSE